MPSQQRRLAKVEQDLKTVTDLLMEVQSPTKIIEGTHAALKAMNSRIVQLEDVYYKLRDLFAQPLVDVASLTFHKSTPTEPTTSTIAVTEDTLTSLIVHGPPVVDKTRKRPRGPDKLPRKRTRGQYTKAKAAVAGAPQPYEERSRTNIAPYTRPIKNRKIMNKRNVDTLMTAFYDELSRLGAQEKPVPLSKLHSYFQKIGYRGTGVGSAPHNWTRVYGEEFGISRVKLGPGLTGWVIK